MRIIPILRRGYSLFSPAPINALTISAFNHIRAEEHQTSAPQTGSKPASAMPRWPERILRLRPPEETEDRKLPAAPPGRLTIPLKGGEVIRFADVVGEPKPMEWTMTFNGKGKLMKATHSPAPMIAEKAVAANAGRGRRKVCPGG